MAPDQKFEVVLWGSTGAVGRRVAHHFSIRNETCGLRWAIGGRNEEKLKTVRASLPTSAQNIPIVIGDSHDKASLTFGHMTDLIGKQPVATLEVTETDLKTGADKNKLKQFIGTIT